LRYSGPTVAIAWVTRDKRRFLQKSAEMRDMTLVLTIENERSLPNGAPVSVRLTGKRGVDIGRSATIDWSLPDPTRFISSRHCEVRYRDDGYWLNDVSTNGTFLNDSARRIQAPYRLRDGDRLTIGSYVIAVAIEPDEADAPALAAAEPALSEAAGVNSLAPREGTGSARLDAEIAQAVAAESAPPQDARTAPDDAAFRQDVAATRPHTMFRARGADSAPLKGPARADDSPAFAGQASEQVQTPEPPPSEAATLDPRQQEARAWSAPEAPGLDPQGLNEGAPAAGALAAEEFLRRFAKGAGVPEQIFARQDGLKVAEELGALMRLAVEDLTQLLNARFKAKRFARASSQTMIQALDNNPLKFAPTATDALKIMFGPRTSGYLDARRALEGAFSDLKSHQIMTYAAMQQAVRMLVEDLDPKAIEDAAGEDKGLAALFGAHKARLWDQYVARWQAKTLRHEDGLVDAFMLYFAQCYDQGKDTE
jgi:type VI secretion system protein ImpI